MECEVIMLRLFLVSVGFGYVLIWCGFRAWTMPLVVGLYWVLARVWRLC